MKVLIVEDEQRAANQLQGMLKSCDIDYHLLGVLESVEETLTWFRENSNPDIIFMDIQLADGLSFEIFQKIEITVPIIFTTAFDQYAIQAFKVNSIDYLLKPIQLDDLKGAMSKFAKTNTSTIDALVLKQLLESIQSTKRTGILVKEGSGFVQLKLTEVVYFYSEDSITFGVTEEKRYIVDETMDQLFESLDNNHFHRINRGQIISKRSLLKIETYFNHRLKLSILNPRRGHEFIVSRQKTTDFKSWMNQ